MELKDKTSEPDDELQVKTWFQWNGIDLAVSEYDEIIEGNEFHVVDIYVTPIRIHRVVADKGAERGKMLQRWTKLIDEGDHDITRSDILCVYMHGKDYDVLRYTTCQHYPYHNAVTFKTFTESLGCLGSDTLDYKGSIGKLLSAIRNHEEGVTELLVHGKYEDFMKRVQQCS